MIAVARSRTSHDFRRSRSYESTCFRVEVHDVSPFTREQGLLVLSLLAEAWGSSSYVDTLDTKTWFIFNVNLVATFQNKRLFTYMKGALCNERLVVSVMRSLE